uniref:Uncharacterized protein n=1 Tax=Cucumis melo TaxID=3656 RepID=A0A9I9CK81_CUCME
MDVERGYVCGNGGICSPFTKTAAIHEADLKRESRHGAGTLLQLIVLLGFNIFPYSPGTQQVQSNWGMLRGDRQANLTPSTIYWSSDGSSISRGVKIGGIEDQEPGCGLQLLKIRGGFRCLVAFRKSAFEMSYTLGVPPG